MNKVINRLKTITEDARYAYADSVTNTFITGQIKALREARELTQEQFAELVGTKQSGISRWQSTGYAGCKVDTLRKFAKAFGVRLRISFEEFGTLPSDIGGFTREKLCPRRFEDDPVFKEPSESEVTQEAEHLAIMEAQIKTLGLFFTDKFRGAYIKISEDQARLLAGAATHADLNWRNQLFHFHSASAVQPLDSAPIAEKHGTATPLTTPVQSEGPSGVDPGLHLVPKATPESAPNPINFNKKIA